MKTSLALAFILSFALVSPAHADVAATAAKSEAPKVKVISAAESAAKSAAKSAKASTDSKRSAAVAKKAAATSETTEIVVVGKRPAAEKPAVKAEVKSEVKAEAKQETKTAEKTAVKTEVKAEVKTETKSTAKTEVKAAAKPEVKPATKAEVKTAAKPAVKTEVAAAKTQLKAEVAPAKPAAKTPAKTPVKSSLKATPKVAAKPATKPVAKPAIKIAAKPTSVVAKKAAQKSASASGLRVAPANVIANAKIAGRGHVVKSVAKTSVRSAQPAKTVAAATASKKEDAATLILKSCLLQAKAYKKSPVACLNRELLKAEAKLDSAEVRIANCAELRKIEKTAEPTFIDTLIRARRTQLRESADSAFKAELLKAGNIGPGKTRMIELRATLAHTEATNKVADKVCNREAFTKMLAK